MADVNEEELEKLIEQRIEEKKQEIKQEAKNEAKQELKKELKQQNKKTKRKNDKKTISRRNFMKKLGLGTAGAAAMTTGATALNLSENKITGTDDHISIEGESTLRVGNGQGEWSSGTVASFGHTYGDTHVETVQNGSEDTTGFRIRNHEGDTVTDINLRSTEDLWIRHEQDILLWSQEGDVWVNESDLAIDVGQNITSTDGEAVFTLEDQSGNTTLSLSSGDLFIDNENNNSLLQLQQGGDAEIPDGRLGIGTSPSASLDINTGDDAVLRIGGSGATTESTLRYVSGFDENDGIGWKAQTFGANIQDSVDANNFPQVRSTDSGYSGASAMSFESVFPSIRFFAEAGEEGDAISEQVRIDDSGMRMSGTADLDMNENDIQSVQNLGINKSSFLEGPLREEAGSVAASQYGGIDYHGRKTVASDISHSTSDNFVLIAPVDVLEDIDPGSREGAKQWSFSGRFDLMQRHDTWNQVGARINVGVHYNCRDGNGFLAGFIEGETAQANGDVSIKIFEYDGRDWIGFECRNLDPTFNGSSNDAYLLMRDAYITAEGGQQTPFSVDNVDGEIELEDYSTNITVDGEETSISASHWRRKFIRVSDKFQIKGGDLDLDGNDIRNLNNVNESQYEEDYHHFDSNGDGSGDWIIRDSDDSDHTDVDVTSNGGLRIRSDEDDTNDDYYGAYHPEIIEPGTSVSFLVDKRSEGRHFGVGINGESEIIGDDGQPFMETMSPGQNGISVWFRTDQKTAGFMIKVDGNEVARDREVLRGLGTSLEENETNLFSIEFHYVSENRTAFFINGMLIRAFNHSPYTDDLVPVIGGDAHTTPGEMRCYNTTIRRNLVNINGTLQ